MTGLDFPTVARELAAKSSEAHARSAISRAYYASFHTARDLIETWGLRVPKGDSAHRLIVRWLQNAGLLQVAKTAIELDSLRTARNRADDELRLADSGRRDFAHRCVKSSGDVIAARQSFDVEPVRSALIQGIQQYQMRLRPEP